MTMVKRLLFAYVLTLILLLGSTNAQIESTSQEPRIVTSDGIQMLYGAGELSPTFYKTSKSGDNPPVIDSITVTEQANAEILIKGNKFGHDANNVMVQLNQVGEFYKPAAVKNKKFSIKLPINNLCTGKVVVTVFVNKVASNQMSFDWSSGKPLITSLPSKAKPGDYIQIKGINFACSPADNTVLVDNTKVPVDSVIGDMLSVKLPSTLGQHQIRLQVGSQISDPLSLTIENQQAVGTDNAPNSPLQYTNVGQPGSAGFGPMFSIDGDITTTYGDTASMWDANYYGLHQMIINLPWTTSDGRPQVALLTLKVGHSNSLIGNPAQGRAFEKFSHMLLQFPLHPFQKYDSLNNPFFWGMSGLVTEHFPTGNLYYNSLTRSTGGVDYFKMSSVIGGKNAYKGTFTLVAPDLYQYQPYGMNYEKQGLPKVVTINFDFTLIDVKIPVPQYGTGNVTFTDQDLTFGTSVTSNTRVVSNVIQVVGVPQL